MKRRGEGAQEKQGLTLSSGGKIKARRWHQVVALHDGAGPRPKQPPGVVHIVLVDEQLLVQVFSAENTD